MTVKFLQGKGVKDIPLVKEMHRFGQLKQHLCKFARG